MIFDKSILSLSLILAGADHAGNADSCYGTQNEQKNTQNNVIEGDIRRGMTVNTDQKYQEKGEAAGNILYQMKQRDQLNKGYDKVPISDVD